MLTKLGHDTGMADGRGGPRTSAAIKDFEKRFGLQGTGKISENLLVYLYGQTVPLKREKWTGGPQGWKESFNWNTKDGSRYRCSYEYVVSDTGDALYVSDTPAECYMRFEFFSREA
jgi:peptidoglycan hydrolase-like protein with peptidoglycan-binding domain